MNESTFDKIRYMRNDLAQLKIIVEKSKKHNFELSVIEDGSNEQMYIPFYAQKYLQKAIESAYNDLFNEYKKL